VRLMIGERLKYLRGKKTQEDIAKYLGISRARYSHYENGRSEPDNETLKKLADFFNVTTDYLLGRTDTPNREASNEQTQHDINFNDPSLGLFFKEIKEAPEEQREQLRKIWEIIKGEGDRKTGNEQK
jgi:transcriptional regulator with XRE-family HTH domain